MGGEMFNNWEIKQIKEIAREEAQRVLREHLAREERKRRKDAIREEENHQAALVAAHGEMGQD